MKRIALMFAVVVSVTQSLAFAGDWTCNAIEAKGWCTQYPSTSKTVQEAGGPEKMGAICTKQGGTWSAAACPTANKLGSCAGERATQNAYTAKAESGLKKTCTAPKTWSGK